MPYRAILKLRNINQITRVQLEKHIDVMQEKIATMQFFMQGQEENTIINIHIKEQNALVMIDLPNLVLASNSGLVCPVDELHAWLCRVMLEANVPFVVAQIVAPVQALVSAPYVSIKCSNEVEIINKLGDQAAIIPGIQLIITRKLGAPSVIKEQVEYDAGNLIRAFLQKSIFFQNKVGKKIELESCYLHSYTKNGFVLILPADLSDVSAFQKLPEIMGRILEEIGLDAYQNRVACYKYKNCFSSIYDTTINAACLDYLEEDSDNIPEDYICSLSGYVMDKAVRLPQSSQIVNWSAITVSMMLNSQEDPFTRTPLTEKEIIPELALQEKINDFVFQKIQKRIIRGTAYFKKNMFEHAIEDYLSVFLYCKGNKISCPNEYMVMMNNLACSYREIKDYGKAAKLFQQLLLDDLRNHIPLKQQAKHFQKLADLYLELRLFVLAKKYYQHSCQILESVEGNNQDVTSAMQDSIAQCDSLMIGVPKRSLQQDSLHSNLLLEEVEFHSQFEKSKDETTISKKKYIHTVNATQDQAHESLCQIKYTYTMEFKKDRNQLEKIAKIYPLEIVSRGILDKVLADLNMACKSATITLIREQDHLVHAIQFTLMLYSTAQQYTMIRNRGLIDNIFHKHKMNLMPQIGAHSETIDRGNPVAVTSYNLQNVPLAEEKRLPDGELIECRYRFAYPLSLAAENNVNNPANVTQLLAASLGRALQTANVNQSQAGQVDEDVARNHANELSRRSL